MAEYPRVSIDPATRIRGPNAAGVAASPKIRPATVTPTAPRSTPTAWLMPMIRPRMRLSMTFANTSAYAGAVIPVPPRNSRIIRKKECQGEFRILGSSHNQIQPVENNH